MNYEMQYPITRYFLSQTYLERSYFLAALMAFAARR
jgi:hypothetical protein